MDPMFGSIDGGARDLTIMSDSPAVDAGAVVLRADGSGDLAVNGQLPGLYEGLAPDLGALERLEP